MKQLRVGPHAATGDLWEYLVANGHASLSLSGGPQAELMNNTIVL